MKGWGWGLSHNRCPHERETLQGIKDIFERLRNATFAYIVPTWLS